MNTVRDLIGSDLEWKQPSALKNEFELRSGDAVVATLCFKSSWGTLATAKVGGDCWTFKRVGFWHTRVTVRSCGSDTEVAVFRNKTWSSGGTLEMPNGIAFRANTNFWESEFGFQNQDGEPLVQFKKGGFLHLSARVAIEPRARDVAELPLITALGWYLIVMMHNDSAAMAAV